MNSAYGYVGVIHQNEDNEFVLSFPDLPGCSASALTEEELRGRAADALAEYLEKILLAGQSTPKPSNFTTILSDPRWREDRATRICAAKRGQGYDDKEDGIG
jgi:predicted RNase H-like HicB family nuclease